MPTRRRLGRSMSRRDFLKVAGAGAVTVGALGAAGERLFAGEPARKPNIVFVFPDQMRQCSWSGGGDAQVKAPNLEAMAREGVTFSHCISNHPLCSPYRASLLTGRYQQAHTVSHNVGNQGGLPLTEITIADVLKKAGYATGYVGKWHLYNGGTGLGAPFVPPGPHRHGFDYWRVCHNYRSRYDTRYYDDNGHEVVLPDYAPKCQMDLMLEFIEKNADKPFCVFLSWHPPHAPYTEAPKRFVDLYAADKIQLRPNVPKGLDGEGTRKNHVGYFSHITALDEEVGRLMKKLAQLGIADHTIVCFSSDHGDMLASFSRYGKNVPWEEAVNVPFLIRWPAGIPAGKRLNTLFSTVDIVPTLLGLAGVPIPPPMQGTDLSAILKGGNAPGPDSVFIMGDTVANAVEDETEGAPAAGEKKKAKGAGDKGRGWLGVRTARFTYAKKGQNPWLLYDNEKDPHQLHNLAEDAGHEPKRKELDAVLAAWLKRVGEA